MSKNFKTGRLSSTDMPSKVNPAWPKRRIAFGNLTALINVIPKSLVDGCGKALRKCGMLLKRLSGHNQVLVDCVSAPRHFARGAGAALILASFLIPSTVKGQLPYVTAATNAPVDTYILQRSGATGGHNRWTPYASTTNAITNMVVRPGLGITVATNVVGVDFTVGSMFATNSSDGSISNINTGSGVVSIGQIAGPGTALLAVNNLATGGRLINAQSNSTAVFIVDQKGDLIRIKNVVYVWPATNAATGQVLASTSAGLLYYTNNGQVVTAGTNIVLTTNGQVVTINSSSSGSGGGVTNNDGSLVNYWQTNSADGSITNINGGNGRVYVSGTNATILSDSLTTGKPLFVGRTNGQQSILVRSDGSLFLGKDAPANGDIPFFDPMFLEQVSNVDSNGPTTIYWEMDSKGMNGSYESVQAWKTIADKDAPQSTWESTAQATNGDSRRIFYVMSPGASQITYQSNSIDTFTVNDSGDLTHIRTIGYHWPSTNGTAGKVLATDGGSPQQLYWTNQNSSGGGGGGGVGPGTLNHLSMFNSTTTNVIDSNLIQEATNQWAYKQSSSTWTNSVTNVWYERWTSGSSNRGIQLIENGNLAELKQFANGTIGADVFGGMRFNDAWLINGLGTVAAGGHNGDWLPLADSDGTTGLTVGNGTHKVKYIYLSTGSAGGVFFPDGGHIQSAGIDTTWGGTAWVIHDTPDNRDLLYVDTGGVNGNTVRIGLGQIGASSGASPGTITASDTWLMAGRLAGSWQLQTNNSGTGTAAEGRLTGSEALGTDHTGGTLILGGGNGNGTGRGGDLDIETAQKASGSSSSSNPYQKRLKISSEPVTLTTNSATTVCTFTVPTSLTMVGAKFSATTEIKDATDVAALTEEFRIVAINKAATVTATNSAPSATSYLATGSVGVSTTWTVTVSSTTVSIKCNAVTTGINATTARVYGRLELDSDGVSVVNFQ